VSARLLDPGGGDAYDWRGARVVLKAAGHHTNGQLAVMESTYPPGLVVPSHVHDGEDELFYLLEGELRVSCGAQRWTATRGSFLLVPRGEPHSFEVVGDTSARALVIVGPPRLDRQVVEHGTKAACD
jgi:quercetin dioxygenase-like cupin family protein